MADVSRSISRPDLDGNEPLIRLVNRPGNFAMAAVSQAGTGFVEQSS